MNGKSELSCERFTRSYYACKLCAYITTCLCVLISSFSAINANSVSQDVPYFADTLNNVTVPVGRDATFQCIVANLKKGYQVAWFHKDKHTLLALQDTVILRSGRLSVSSHAGTTFYLHIHDIREDDRGEYMCQINTNPMKSQVAFLHVVVPPKFIEGLTSSDTTVPEDSSASLVCKANGFPRPEIKWRREDGQTINLNNSSNNQKTVSHVNGERLNITKVTRLHMGAYICIASNGIPPSVSKRIFLAVNFSPMIWTPNQIVGAPIGSDVTLECSLESHPSSTTNWTRNGGQTMITSNEKYQIYEEQTNSPHRVELRLKIMDLRPWDYDTYACKAKNLFGEAQGTIKLFETAKPSTQSDLNFVTKDSNSKRKHFHGTRSSLSFDDFQGGDRSHNKPIVIAEVLGYEITSEHITLQSEDKVTINSYNHNNGITRQFSTNLLIILITILIVFPL